MRRLVLVAAAAWPLAVCAGEAHVAALPPEAQVREALRALPQVQAARAGVALERANRSRLEAGPYEWTVSGAAQQRRETLGPRFMEHSIGIERTLRWPGKAERDAAIGEAGVHRAQAALGDAWHEAARALLQGWFAWMREAAARAALREQVALMEQQVEVARKRVQAGDAARVELLLAQTERERVQAAERQAAQRTELAALDLERRFPGMRAALPASLPAPEAPADDGEAWLKHVLEDNHEIALARAEARQARLAAERAERSRTPDPTLGVRYAEERSRQERILGLTLSIPLPGEARHAEARAGAARAAIAEERARQVALKVSSDAARAVANERSTFSVWSALARVAEQTRANAALVSRAYALGEASLSDTLLARRQALDAALAATATQLDALEAAARLALDAHHLWALDEEEAKHSRHGKSAP